MSDKAKITQPLTEVTRVSVVSVWGGMKTTLLMECFRRSGSIVVQYHPLWVVDAL